MKNFTALLIILVLAASFAITFIPQTQAATSDAKILSNYTFYTDNLGYLVVVGEVQNTGNSVLKNIGVAGALTEADGTYDTSATYAWGDYILPGQKAPFYLEFKSEGTSITPWTGITAEDITLTVNVAPEASQYQYQGVTIQSQKDTPKSNGEFWVTAEVKNSGSESASNVVLIATFYNSEGKPIGTGYSSGVTIAAGASQTIKVPAFDLNQTVVSSDKIIKSWSLLMEVASPLESDGNYPRYSVSPDDGSQGGLSTPSSSMVYNNGNPGVDMNIVYVVVGVVAVVVAVVALMALKKRKAAPVAAMETKKADVVKPKKGKKHN
jgi:hypothetical protein